MVRVEKEIQNRELVAIWAYAYEILNESIVPDSVFDQTCLTIDTALETGDLELDLWFRNNFDPCTGQWIWKHPHLEQIKNKAEALCV